MVIGLIPCIQEDHTCIVVVNVLTQDIQLGESQKLAEPSRYWDVLYGILWTDNLGE